MKFYSVKDSYGYYKALVWADNDTAAAQAYRKGVVAEPSLSLSEVDVDEVYKQLIANAKVKPNCAFPDFGVMGMLQNIISSSTCAIVFTR